MCRLQGHLLDKNSRNIGPILILHFELNEGHNFIFWSYKSQWVHFLLTLHLICFLALAAHPLLNQIQESVHCQEQILVDIDSEFLDNYFRTFSIYYFSFADHNNDIKAMSSNRMKIQKP